MTSDSPKLIVVDASVALKWHLRDEEASEEADALLDAFWGDKIALAAPSLIHYEIANALRSAVLRHRLAMEEARQALLRHQKITIQMFDFEEFALSSFDLSALVACSVYDASYAVLARFLDTDFVTGDRRLVGKIGGHFAHIHWIGDFALKELGY